MISSHRRMDGPNRSRADQFIRSRSVYIRGAGHPLTNDSMVGVCRGGVLSQRERRILLRKAERNLACLGLSQTKQAEKVAIIERSQNPTSDFHRFGIV